MAEVTPNSAFPVSATAATASSGCSGERSFSSTGVRFSRRFTKPGVSPYDEVAWERRTASITDVAGKVIFEQKEVEVPTDWSMTATNIVASKYLHGHIDTPQGEFGARETGVRQLVARVAETVRDWGQTGGYFATQQDAEIFHDELVHLLLSQKAAFNSPVWFNVGCDRLEPNSDAHNWHWNPHTCAVEFSVTGYRNPQCSACFINSVEDSLDSILTLAKTEGMLFKWGSGTGTNLSTIRGSMEVLSGGGTASGPLSFMRGFDAFAGVIKSGGKTRRAAKMVILNVDHPDIVDFIECKAKEEAKAWSLMQAGYDGSGPDSEAYSSIFFQNANNSVRVTDDFMRAVERDQEFATRTVKAGEPVQSYRARDLIRKIAEATWQCGDPGMQYDTTINRWHTSKNSGRINASNPCSEYMFLDDSACNLASFNLLKFVNSAGVFDVPAYRHAIAVMITAMDILVDNSGYPTESIARTSHDYRPLGLGYANLGALLMAFGLPYDSDAGRDFAAALTAIMCGQAYLQSSVLAAEAAPLASATPLCQEAQYEEQSGESAPAGGARSSDMRRGLSLEQGRRGGACPGYYVNREPFLDVIRMHRAEVNKIGRGNTAEPFAAPQLESLLEASRACWDQALAHGEQHGFRNSQVTVLAPTGTIGFMMDCDTTGIEPDLALVKYKKLVGGGMIKIVNSTVPAALFKLGYSNPQVDSIVSYIDSTGTIEGAPGIKAEHLAVFDCSFKPSKGTRSIHSSGHVKMMAAAQPFLSGAISKTVNLPHDCTVDDIVQTYIEAWRQGLKAVAVYRDGSKGAQPLNVSDGDKAKVIKNALASGSSSVDPAASAAADRVLEGIARGSIGPVADDLRILEDKVSAKLEVTAKSVLAAANAFTPAISNAMNAAATPKTDAESVSGPPRALRHRLPEERASLTHKFSIAGHEGYITVGLYPSGQPGEIFIKMAKEGSTVSGLMDSFATAVSLSLQHGVPLKVLVEKFAHTRFEPSGWTGNKDIGFAKSIMDYIFRWLQLRFLSGHQLSLFASLAGPAGPSAALSETQPSLSPFSLQPESFETRSPAGGLAPDPGANPSGALSREDASNAGSRPFSLEDRGFVKAPEAHKGGGAIYHPADAMRQYLDMGDAPSCQTCGAIMVRNGSCYRCMSCGSTSGCS